MTRDSPSLPIAQLPPPSQIVLPARRRHNAHVGLAAAAVYHPPFLWFDKLVIVLGILTMIVLCLILFVLLGISMFAWRFRASTPCGYPFI